MTDFAVATLLLRTAEVSTTESSQGISNAANTAITWYNINLRILLGDMYDEYETFNLSLTSIASAKTPAALGPTFGNSDIDNLQLSVYIGGLPFLNNTYAKSRGGNIDSAILGVFTYPSGATALAYRVYNQSGTLTFGKNQELCNITVTLKRVSDDAPPDTTLAFPHLNMVFSINGVRRASKTNGTRI